MVGEHRGGAVELLGGHQAHQHVRQRERAERPLFVGTREHVGRVAFRAANHESEVAALAQAMLEELGHTVLFADTCEAALEIAAREPDVGLVLSDVIMPGGRTGVDLAVELTARQPGLPVVLTSGFTGEALAGAEAAPWPLLRKPYAMEELADAIAAAMDSSAAPFVEA